MAASPDFDSLARVALEAVSQAASVCRDKIGNAGERFAKSERDFATEADLAAEAAARQVLKQLTPGIGFFGEEAGGGDPASGRDTWVLDPIDGTLNFTHGLPLCGVSLALYSEGVPILGVIELPFLGERYIAARGRGAWMNGKKIGVRGVEGLREAMATVAEISKPEAREVHREMLSRCSRVRHLGATSVDLCWVSGGRTNAYFNFANKSYDVGAGVIIAREAGASVFDWNGSDHSLASRWTLISHPSLKEEIVDICRAFRRKS
jgi:myo-inositol-1(or 4)-monophosphatase